MNARLLTCVAATALIAGSLFAAAEGTGPAPAPGATEPKTGNQPKAPEPKAKPDGKGTQAQPGAQPMPGTPKAGEPKVGEPKTKDSSPKEPPKTVDPKAKNGTSPQPKAGEAPVDTKITVQQRTEIRQVITQDKSAPRVTNVNFNISIGTVVPRTVQVAVLPTRVVEIYPVWRGYRYFIVGERIIIIDDSYRIVFVIDV